MSAWFYLLRLKSGGLYPGATENLDQRLKDHTSGRACRTTKLDPPVALARAERFDTFAAARRREAQVKRWTGAKKEALTSGDIAALKRLAKRRVRATEATGCCPREFAKKRGREETLPAPAQCLAGRPPRKKLPSAASPSPARGADIALR